jgi:hypothetical protein
LVGRFASQVKNNNPQEISNPLQKSNKANPEDNYNLFRQIAVCQTKKKKYNSKKNGKKKKKLGCEVGFVMV